MQMHDSIQTLYDFHLVKNQINKYNLQGTEKDGIWIADNITVFESCIGTNINSSRFTTFLLWECHIIINFGLFFIMEQAGGLSTTGRRRVMEIQPEVVHQRVPVIMGSKNDIQEIIDAYAAWDNKW